MPLNGSRRASDKECGFELKFGFHELAARDAASLSLTAFVYAVGWCQRLTVWRRY